MVGWMWVYYKLHEAIEVAFVCSLFLTGVYCLPTGVSDLVSLSFLDKKLLACSLACFCRVIEIVCLFVSSRNVVYHGFVQEVQYFEFTFPSFPSLF